jgi:hypothetical protein
VSYVVIGIDQYQRWPRLRHAVSDALGAARLFEHLGCAQAAPPLLDGAATRDAMHRLATVDLAHLTLDDSLVVFFAGHGHTHTADFTDVLVKTGYVVPADGALPDHHAAATWLRLDGWLSDIARLPPRHILVMIDACHGGVTLGDLHRWRDEGSLPVSDLSALRERRSRRVIISALDDQRAMDHGPYPGHSLFTGCLIEALLGGLATHGQRATTGRALGQYLRTRVATYPQSAQTPDCGAFELDDRGDIVLPVQPPGTSRVEQSSLVAHAPAPESRPPSLVGVVAPHRPGQPSTVGRTMRSRRARGGAVAVVVAVLGVCVAFGYARMRNAAITGDAGLTSGGSMEVHKAASDDGAPRGAWPPSPPSPPAAPPTPLPDPATTGTAAPIDVKAASAEITLADRARADAIARDRKLLFDHIDRQLARSRHDERYFSYRILRGQLFLVALIRGAGLPSAEYAVAARLYR